MLGSPRGSARSCNRVLPFAGNETRQFLEAAAVVLETVVLPPAPWRMHPDRERVQMIRREGAFDRAHDRLEPKQVNGRRRWHRAVMTAYHRRGSPAGLVYRAGRRRTDHARLTTPHRLAETMGARNSIAGAQP